MKENICITEMGYYDCPNWPHGKWLVTSNRFDKRGRLMSHTEWEGSRLADAKKIAKKFSVELNLPIQIERA